MWVLITVWRLWTSFRSQGFLWILLALVVFIFFFHKIDSLFEVPEQFYNSSYWFAWKGGGSENASKISANGFNIWMFLGRDMRSSSSYRLFILKVGNWKYNVSPDRVGIMLYAMFISFISFTC